MNNYLKTIILLLLLIIFVSLIFFIIYSSYKNTSTNTTFELKNKAEDILNILKSNDNNIYLKDNILNENYIINTTSSTDTLLSFKTNKYKVILNKKTNKIDSIENLKPDYNNTLNSDLNVEEIAMNLYNTLNLPKEYELVFYFELENSNIYEVNFQKKYGDIYNPYESVKIFFIPYSKEVISLKVFNIPYIQKANEIILSRNLAINKYFKEEDIKDSKLGFININGVINKVWIIYILDLENSIYYINAINGNIIGGDYIK